MLKSSFAVLLAASLLVKFIWNVDVAESLLIGGLVSIIPHFVFAKVFFYYQGARKSKQIIKYFYIGEGIKILLTTLLLAISLAYLKLDNVGFFIGFVGMVIVQIGLSLSAGIMKIKGVQ